MSREYLKHDENTSKFPLLKFGLLNHSELLITPIRISWLYIVSDNFSKNFCIMCDESLCTFLVYDEY